MKREPEQLVLGWFLFGLMIPVAIGAFVVGRSTAIETEIRRGAVIVRGEPGDVIRCTAGRDKPGIMFRRSGKNYSHAVPLTKYK